MFFLGLLSTPLPYLLLAAFYFFGFAMGLFNNSSGEEPVLVEVNHSIRVENNQNPVEKNTFFLQFDQLTKHQYSADILSTEDTLVKYFPDTGKSPYWIRNAEIIDFNLTGFRFSRPPPAV